MTIVSSGPISIQSLKDEYYGGGGPSEMNHYCVVVLGRGDNTPSSLYEYYGKSNIISYDVYFPPYPCNYTAFSFDSKHGTVWYNCSSHESGGVNTQRMDLVNNFGNLTWTKFIRTEIPWMGPAYTWGKATWEQYGGDLSWAPGNFGGGNIKFFFYG